ncbi:hypothetical protein Tco_0104428 [Tanacetum coccineum]
MIFSIEAPPPVVEPFNLEEPLENPPPPLARMNDQHTMAQLLEAPTAGYVDAIVVPEITADNFELKHGLLSPRSKQQFFVHDKDRSSCRYMPYFKQEHFYDEVPGTVPITSEKLMLFTIFPYSSALPDLA